MAMGKSRVRIEDGHTVAAGTPDFPMNMDFNIEKIYLLGLRALLVSRASSQGARGVAVRAAPNPSRGKDSRVHVQFLSRRLRPLQPEHDRPPAASGLASSRPVKNSFMIITVYGNGGGPPVWMLPPGMAAPLPNHPKTKLCRNFLQVPSFGRHKQPSHQKYHQEEYAILLRILPVSCRRR